MIRRVLVVIDAFPASQRALPWVRRLLAPTGGHVRLLAVLPPSGPHVVSGTRTVTYADQREDAARRAYEFKLAVLATGLRDEGLEVGVEVRFGEAGTVAVAAAREWAADAIAVIDARPSGLLQWFRKSVAEKVLATSVVPVLIARTGQRAA